MQLQSQLQDGRKRAQQPVTAADKGNVLSHRHNSQSIQGQGQAQQQLQNIDLPLQSKP